MGTVARGVKKPHTKGSRRRVLHMKKQGNWKNRGETKRSLPQPHAYQKKKTNSP